MLNTEIIRFGETPLGSEYGEEEVSALVEVIRQSMDPSVGFRAEKETREFEEKFVELCGTQFAIALNSGGGALDLLLRALHLEDTDEVVSCSINFPGTHLAVVGSGAKLVLCEPDSSTLNLDPLDLGKRLTPRTKAVVVTYMNGLAADMDRIQTVIEESDLFGDNKPKIIVDAARSLGTIFKGNHVGGEAWATFFSFQSKKMITTLGEGAMVVTDDPNLDKLLREYRSFGMSEAWGTNYKLTKPQSAVGMVQLRRLNELVKSRRELAAVRNMAFSKIEGITILQDTEFSQNSYYLYTLILPVKFTAQDRDELRVILLNQYGIGTVVGNPPTYKSNKLLMRMVGDQSLPVAESLGNRIICLPLHPIMNQETNQYIIDSFFEAYASIV